MPSEKANDDGALAKQVGGIHVDMILIEQGEFRSAISDFEGSILHARGFELSFRLPGYLAQLYKTENFLSILTVLKKLSTKLALDYLD